MIKFKTNPDYVMFPITDDGKNFIKVTRPIAMPLKEMHGEKVLTMGYDDNTGLLAYQLVEKPYTIRYAYKVSPVMAKAIMADCMLNEERTLDIITSTYMVVEESCEVYHDDHVSMSKNIKLTA